MDSWAFGLTLVAAVALLGLIVQLIRERLAEMEETGEIDRKAVVSEPKDRTESENSQEYGPIDCYGDCMRAFRWQSREGAECARACGLNPS